LGSDEWFVSYYNDEFPAAAPSFSEAQARVPRAMEADSVFRLRAGDEIVFSMKGLYLIQKDTNALEGLAFRSEDDYPQYTKLASLPGPLIYITTKQEYDRLETVDGNKRAFDRIILQITLDTDRARTLMRSYFRRVELANRFFTSYKQGWKTDRGMIYIIFGKPDEVFRFDDREVWRYDNERFKNISFNFSRSTSVFDPDNFVLIREKKYEDTWYEVIDLWRNARF
jgi:GWxTD domain-containing protein